MAPSLFLRWVTSMSKGTSDTVKDKTERSYLLNIVGVKALSGMVESS